MDEAKADINCISSAGGITSGSTATGAKEVTTSSSSSASTSSSTSAADPEAEDSEKKKKFGKKVQLPIKQIISLDQLRQRFADTAMPPKEIEVIVNSPDSKRKTVKKLKHSLNEFYTFCTCPQCLEYREVILLLMDDQMKTRSTWEILQATLRKAYQPILKNAVSLVKYESFLASEGATWLTTGDVNHTKAQHLNFICDLSLTENMVSVLLSALLLVDDPHQLFELMTFQVECVVKAYWEGFSEIAKMQDKKIPAEEMLSYVLEGYDELCTVSDNISRFLFAFENHHLKKFSLTWTMLNKRMYQQHVYSNITNTMLACIITLKEDELTKKHSMLIKKYIQFDDEMIQMDRLWKDTWTALNLYNLSEEERNRRGRMKSIHDLFNVIRNDVIGTFSQCVDIAEWATHENRQLVWQSMLAYVVKNGADAYSVHLNTIVCDDKCRECNELLEYHMGSCKCVTCAIAGGPLPPKRHPDSTCVRCLTLSRAEKEGALYESKILNVCASDDLFAYKSHNRRRTNSIEDLSDTSSLSLKDEVFNEPDELYEYHLSWAVFKHLRDRKPYVYSRIDEKYFCADCRLPSCLLAKKILNNEIALALSWHLIQHYQPLIMTHEDLTLMLKNIMQYNRKVVASKLRMDPHLDDEVFKIYWAFAVSVIACYFVEFDEETQLNLDYFDLVNNDIQLVTARLKGAEKDGKFFQFLDKISGLSLNEKENKETNRTFESCSGSSSVTTSPDRIEHNVAEYLKGESSKLTENTEEVRTPESEPPEPVTPTESFHPKKCGKDKSKKCCFDHADMSDHCKENHSSKKRIKKECNHARMNETRDRLRKKLSQLVNARKNIKTPILRPPHQQPHCSKTLTPPDSEEPSLADVKLDDDDDSLECLSTLCKRITHQPNKQAPSTSGNPSKKSVFHQSQQQAQPAQVQQAEETQAPPPPPPPTVTIKKRSNSHQALSPNSGRQRANEFFALLENLPEVSVKKWVNETLSFIEGSSDTKGPVNEKKAAKKAKQKQRKEEMKRIAELQDLRSQFHDIYFKEFAAKYELKILKVSKKKDKKKITDFEANIKKLNRAKAKVETNILELIATVKQTNGEFKFSYLPTKEQQVEKLQELTKEDDDSAQQNQSNSTSSTPSPATEILPPAGALPPQENNLNGGAYYGIPYANANNFAPFAVPNFVSTPNVQMCYAPNQPTDMTDPSKRIVTIRRVNLPNVPEPQVTVTAKGSSPDKDKLLYTFVNGQIVQTSHQQAQQDQQQPQQQQQHAQQQQQAQQQHHQAPSPPVEVPQKTKTQLKKERKRAKKLAEAEEECERLAEEERLLKEEEAKREEELRRQEELKKQEQAAAAKASKKANNKKKATTAATAKVENKLPSNNKKPKKNATPAPSVTSSSQPTTRENSVCSQKVKPKPTAQVREKPPEREKQEAQPSPARTVSKDKEKRQKFIDNGQFDNNQFKMLHLDDFVSSDSAESDVESERECEVEKKVVVPTKPKVVEKPQAPAPVTTSTTTTSTTAPANVTNIPQKPAEAKPKPKPQQAAIKVPPQPQPEPVAEKPSKEQPPPVRRENKERNSRSVKPSPTLPPATNHERNNERNRNKSNNMPTTRRPSIQIQSQQFVPSQHLAQQQRELLLDKPKRSRKSKNKVQGSIYQATPTVAPNANPKLRRNQSVIYSSSGSKTDPTNALQQSMQNLRLTSNNYPQLPPQQQSNHHDRPDRHHYSQQQQQQLHQQNHSNVSIMDQLNRGVQVENLSLPPGITLTKVDPSKSEQLRAKSESIKKLSKPLPHVAASTSNMSQPTIITSGFYPHMSTYGASDHNGVIMVEAMGGASKQINKQQVFSNEGKVSKNRKRRNKKKSDNFKASSAAPPSRNPGGETESSPKMVTLRNPMFGNMMPQSTPSVMPLPNRLPVAPLPMDQPASIIKNENGMFTIRNPALQAAVANGLPVTSYRQFTGNYYTPPQEPIGSGSGASLGSSNLGATTGLGASSSFSYFSNNTTSTHVPNSQTIALDPFNSSNGYACDINDGSLRPNNTGKCISAIGSEVKTAQQLKQRSKESQWQNFSTLDSTPSHDNACNYLGSSLQSNYYNGYDVFSSSSGGSQQLSSSGSLFENSDCPLHHNCEDSPPPTITGFNHYLDGIPNTGIIRYDDASFLKTLMPGQNLNNEVSIHNVNDSNFARNATSPVAHRVEITPVYGNRPTATSLFNNCSNPTQYSPTKGFQPHTHLGGVDFSENLFTPNTLLNLNDLDSGERDVEAFKRFSYDFEPPKEKQKVNININDLFMKSSRSGNSSRSSPFMDDSTLGLEGFVQNLSALKLTDEQCSAVNGNINAGTSPNGWW